MQTRRLSIIAIASAGCAGEPATLTTADLIGSWNGTASNGYSFTYTFEASGAFSWSLVGSSGTALLADGTFSTSAGKLILDGTFRGEEGDSYRRRVELSPYASSSVLCDGALTSDRHDGEVGTWTNITTLQSLDANDLPIGEPTTIMQVLDLRADGTAVEMTLNGASRSGTYSREGNAITTTFTFGNVSAVRTYTLVDDSALCDPVYARS